jgi:hypothetical protein
MSTIDTIAESLERRYRALQSKLEPPGRALLDRLFREFKYYGEAAWFTRHLKWLEDQFTPEAEEARRLKRKGLRAAASRRARRERWRRGRQRGVIETRVSLTRRNAR